MYSTYNIVTIYEYQVEEDATTDSVPEKHPSIASLPHGRQTSSTTAFYLLTIKFFAMKPRQTYNRPETLKRTQMSRLQSRGCNWVLAFFRDSNLSLFLENQKIV